MTRFIVVATLIALIAGASLSLSNISRADEPAPKTENVKIPAREGVELDAVVHHPVTWNGVAVVLGSGKGCHKDLPLLVKTANALQEAGFLAIRFDWAYFTAKTKHAQDLSTELKDLETVIDYAKARDGFKRLYLAGKSLGSVAATMRALKQPDDIDGLILLTLPIHAPEKPKTYFDDMVKLMKTWTKRVMIVCGDSDPYSELDALYRYAAGYRHAAGINNTPRLVIVPGDHGMHGPEKNEARTSENCDLAARGIALWASRWQQAGPLNR